MTAICERISVVHAAAMSRRAALAVARADGGAWRVHSVFRRCFNITALGGDWLTVAIAPFPQTPDAVIVDAPSEFIVGVEQHMPVEIGPDDISIPDAGVAIVLAGADIFDTQRTPFARIDGAARNLSLALETIRRDGRTCDAPEFLRRVEPAVSALREAILRDDAATMRAQCEQLLGLGIGLTPSGDDILGGIAAGLFLGGGAGEGGGRQFLSVLRGLLRDGMRTTDVSARSLRLCVDGEISDIVYEAARAILCGDETETKHAVRTLLAQGGTSGTETAQGLCLGLQLSLNFYAN